jgi:glycosyltransferase involved in cell wall biosynthesis
VNGNGPRRGGNGIVVVGPGERFISGISHYTRYVAEALSKRTPTSVISMRKLIPRFLYPGRERVGAKLTETTYPESIPVFAGIDWYSIPSMVRAARFLRRRRPEAMLMQWWTGAVLHSYLVLAFAARRQGVRIVIEIHEIQDSGEAGLAPARLYTERLGKVLMGMADAFVVHSDFDREALAQRYELGARPVEVIGHGPYSHYDVANSQPLREAPEESCNFLFFGTIRPYKGLEDLVRAFESLAESDPSRSCWLTVVGETWEGWTEPIELIEASPCRERITLVNRYVTDEDASRWFAGADVVVLPYRRSSASGPLHMTMSAGLPVVVTDVGGLGQAVGAYEGAILVAAGDTKALAAAMGDAVALRGRRFPDRTSWAQTAGGILAVIDSAG